MTALQDATPIRAQPNRCAVIIRKPSTGQWNGNCEQPPKVQGQWTFHAPKRHTQRVLLCEEHAAVLAGERQLTLDRRQL